MVVQHNLTAMNSNRNLGLTTASQAKSTERLSSGYKINRAADDAAGLSISEKMRKQIRGLTQASANAQDGISAVQTAEGALTEVHDMLQRMNELAVKASNGTMSEDDRTFVQDEVNQLVNEIDRVSQTTKFNETYLLDGKRGSNGIPNPSYSGATTGNLCTGTGITGNIGGAAATGILSDIQANGTATVALVAGAGAAGDSLTYKDDQGQSVTIKFDDTATENVTTGPARVYKDKESFVSAAKTAIMSSDKNIKDVYLDASGNLKIDAFADTKEQLNISLQVGSDTTANNKIDMNLEQLSARGLGINGIRVDGYTSSNADAAVNTIADAVRKVSTQRSSLGAVQNRLEHTINNLDNIVENTTAAESSIRDTDMATEMVKYSNNNILSQAGQAMLAQANQVNQGVLSLIG